MQIANGGIVLVQRYPNEPARTGRRLVDASERASCSKEANPSLFPDYVPSSETPGLPCRSHPFRLAACRSTVFSRVKIPRNCFSRLSRELQRRHRGVTTSFRVGLEAQVCAIRVFRVPRGTRDPVRNRSARSRTRTKATRTPLLEGPPDRDPSPFEIRDQDAGQEPFFGSPCALTSAQCTKE